MITLLRRLSRLGFRKGMGGGGRAWLALGLLSWFVARNREKSKEPPPNYREVLSPGESIAIRIFEPPG
ncbi:MAG TPA: hypothetical protein VGF00_08020 [Acidimicrobiia bacterium]|nr:hypothetical protein [Actinomycetota bacterium]MDQ1501438.1 hypothetical protein [Actinomycetota bacterium]MDQ1506449.1 hypothetical protein [Actinomycetota bacterium]MDQ1566288.1 hypothetical protein [Actinomycetota bacterium]